jgi:hypothetical protein
MSAATARRPPAALTSQRDDPDDRAKQILERLAELRELLEAKSWENAEWFPDTEAARRLGTSTQTLANDRVSGQLGLVWSKPIRRVMYKASSVAELLSRGQCTSTAEDKK